MIAEPISNSEGKRENEERDKERKQKKRREQNNRELKTTKQ